MQAPIEISTYDQVKTIRTFGVYRFCCKYHQMFCSNKDIFSLRIEGCLDCNTVYTLNDLKDLESKIILIRDSRSTMVNGQSTESLGLQEVKLNLSTSSYMSLLDKLSSTEVEEFLCVRELLYSM